MTQQQVKKVNPAPAVKTEGFKEVKEITLKAVETTKNASESVVNASTDAVRELLANGAQEARRAHERAVEFSRESADNFTKSTEAFSRNVSEFVNYSKEQAEINTELANLVAQTAKTVSTDFFAFANSTLTANIETSKELFACKNVNEFVALQSKLFRTNVDAFFGQTLKASEQFFKFSAESVEPINNRAAEAFTRFTKALTEQ